MGQVLWQKWLVAAVFMLSYSSSAQDNIGSEIMFPSSDGLMVSGYWHDAMKPTDIQKGQPTSTILLFHMAGSSAKGEYTEIVPVLNAAGYNTFAIDLRSGGDRLGVPNQTALRFGDQDIGYCEAYPDLLAALNWASDRSGSGPLIAVGSSFSAGLVIKLAAENPDKLSGAIAFSPASGAPMADCRPESLLDDLKIPLIALRPDREMAIESVQAQAEVFKQHAIPYIEIENGRHGSLMLRSSQTGVDMAHAWGPVLEFLDGVTAADELSELTVDGWILNGDLLVPSANRPRPAVLLLHGAAKTRARHDVTARELAARGIASLRLDLRAHGTSTNKGMFQQPWDDHLHLLDGTERDIVAALEMLAADPRIDAGRIGVVSASYSGEFAAKAAAISDIDKAHASLAPGSFSEESIRAIDPSGKAWFFIRAEREFDFFDEIFASIAENSKAEVLVLPGDAHADGLLQAHPPLARRLAAWFESKL